MRTAALLQELQLKLICISSFPAVCRSCLTPMAMRRQKRFTNPYKIFMGGLYHGIDRSQIEAELTALGLAQPDVGLYIVAVNGISFWCVCVCLKDKINMS